MTIERLNPAGLYDPSPNGYSHIAQVHGASRLVFIAGQGGEDRSGILPPRTEDQIQNAFNNLSIALQAVGAEPHQVVRLTTYLVGYNGQLHQPLTRIIKRMFGPHLPTQTLVPVPRLALEGMLFEVDAIAVLPDAS